MPKFYLIAALTLASMTSSCKKIDEPVRQVNNLNDYEKIKMCWSRSGIDQAYLIVRSDGLGTYGVIVSKFCELRLGQFTNRETIDNYKGGVAFNMNEQLVKLTKSTSPPLSTLDDHLPAIDGRSIVYLVCGTLEVDRFEDRNIFTFSTIKSIRRLPISYEKFSSLSAERRNDLVSSAESGGSCLG